MKKQLAEARIRELETLVENLTAQNRTLAQHNAILSQQLDYFKRQIFGRKSERFEHPDFFEAQNLGTTEEAESEHQGEVEETAGPAKQRKRRRVRAERLPDNLPEVVENIVPPEVEANPEAWRHIGQEESRQLELQPGYLYVRRTVRHKYVSIEEPLKAPVIVPAAPSLVLGGFWGPELVSEILCDRFLDHLPYYRQETRYLRRFSVDLSRKTMCDYAERIGGELEILVRAMKEKMLLGPYIRADETAIRYLDAALLKGSALGYYWTYRGVGGDVIFDWQTSREHRHLAEWLGRDYEGTLQSDGYKAYVNYCVGQGRIGKQVQHARCLAHIRRKFEAALEERPEVVGWVLRIIRMLYTLEQPMREYGASPEVRVRVRQNRSRGLIALLEKAFTYLRGRQILPQSRLGRALRYALENWPGMKVYLEDGRVDIDNNAIENDIRPTAIGKKNWLFMGSAESGTRNAVFYTLLISARNHGVDPRAYLKDVMQKLPGRKADDIEDLLPENWAAANRDKYPLVLPPRKAA